ncbi:MAG: hypothetical protein ACRD0A_20325 [Acidimicrobiales bacterium]
MTLAVVWHFWIGVALMLAAIGVVVATIGGYLFKVTRSRYPSRGQQR